MNVTLSESTPKARKDYDCDACTWLINSDIDGQGFTRPELRSISAARKNKWRIAKGQKYLRQNNVFDGAIRTFKAIPEIDAICHKYDLYDI